MIGSTVDPDVGTGKTKGKIVFVIIFIRDINEYQS